MTKRPGLSAHVFETNRGATAQSWRQANPRNILKQVLEHTTNKHDKDQVYSEFREQIDGNSFYIDAIIEYWFVNNYRSLTVTRISPEERERREDAYRKIVQKKIGEGAKILLLEMLMPNGKALKDCTGEECRLLGSKMNSWLTLVASKVAPSQTIGSALSEDEVRVLYQSAGVRQSKTEPKNASQQKEKN